MFRPRSEWPTPGGDLLPQIAPAVEALRRGNRVPAPFDYHAHVWSVLERAEPAAHQRADAAGRCFRTVASELGISTLFHSAMGDSLDAALEVLVRLAYVHGRDGHRQAYSSPP